MKMIFRILSILALFAVMACSSDTDQQGIADVDYQINIYAGGELKINSEVMTLEQFEAELIKFGSEKSPKVSINPASDVRMAELNAVRDLLRKYKVVSISYTSS